MLKDVKIGLFISGGIAAYKMAELSRQLIKQGAKVRVAMTENAQEFLSPLTMQILTQDHVLVDTFDEKVPNSVQHIAFADWLDIALVAPATANTLGKMARGIGDEVVSTTLLAVNKPRVVVPAMNTRMYENPATVENIERLKTFGYHVMDPDTGFLAEGYEGKGRLPELSRIIQQVTLTYWQNQLPQMLAGKKVLVSAGGTIEAIDPVRYISNRSSGKMGYAMAFAAQCFGAEVNIVSTRPNLLPPDQSQVVYVNSAQEMYSSLKERFPETDYLVMAAAVSDYRLAQPSEQKIKKNPEESAGLTIQLIENPDIIANLAQVKSKQVLIGFAAETEKVEEYAKAKLAKKDIDWIIANDVSDQTIGFNSQLNRVSLFNRQGNQFNLPEDNKEELAIDIWQTILTQ